MSNEEFIKQQKNAVERMIEMNSRSTNPRQGTPPTSPRPANQQQALPLLDGFGFNLSKLLKEKDTALILGLMLILLSENADKRLLFALVYILL